MVKIIAKNVLIYRNLDHPEGIKSSSWKGGLSLNKTSGYLRINKNNEYYHKKIFGDYLGRKLTRKEQVHHIDMDKLNNNLDNFFLCRDKREHNQLHSSMEILAFELFTEEKIFFDKKQNIYTLDRCDNDKIIFIPSKKPTCKCLWRNGKYYESLYLGNKKHIAYYRFVIEEFTGKKLNKDIQVHHIDGNTLNNDINNIVALSRKKHRECHNSLQNCVKELYKIGVVKFSKEAGRYHV